MMQQMVERGEIDQDEAEAMLGVKFEDDWPGHIPSPTVSGGGAWPTPNAREDRAERYTPETSWRHFKEGRQVHLSQVVRFDEAEWRGHIPSPTVSDSYTGNLESTQQKSGVNHSVPRTSVGGGGVLPTPQTTDAPAGGGPPNKNANTTQWDGVNSLGQMAKQGLWPTPRVDDSKNNGSVSQQNRHGPAFNVEVQMWPTPHSSAGTGPGTQGREGGLNIQTAVQNEAAGQLSPTFVEFLMGLPQGWTSLDPLPDEHWQRWLSEPHWEHGEWPGVPRVSNGVKDRVNRLKALGNGIVPKQCAAFLQKIQAKNREAQAGVVGGDVAEPHGSRSDST